MAADVETGPPLSDIDREALSVDAIRHLSAEIAGLCALRGQVALARSILGHAPPFAAARKALLALEGRPLDELTAIIATQAVIPDGPAGIEAYREAFCDGWQSGWNTGYKAGRDRRENTYSPDGTAA